MKYLMLWIGLIVAIAVYLALDDKHIFDTHIKVKLPEIERLNY